MADGQTTYIRTICGDRSFLGFGSQEFECFEASKDVVIADANLELV